MQEDTMKFTTSWDDGCARDLRVASILADAGCTGTFYVCPQPNRREALLSAHECAAIAARHEIGAHTLTHPHLPVLPSVDARREIEGSKRWIEERTGKPCTMFCYPYGNHTESVRALVRAAGFRGARTTLEYAFATDDPYALGTSVHIYPYPLRPVCNRRAFAPVIAAWPHLARCGVKWTARFHWQTMSRAVFLHARESGKPWFHLWGHSWELDRYDLWDDLCSFLRFVREFPDVRCVPNSSLLPHAHSPPQ